MGNAAHNSTGLLLIVKSWYTRIACASHLCRLAWYLWHLDSELIKCSWWLAHLFPVHDHGLIYCLNMLETWKPMLYKYCSSLMIFVSTVIPLTHPSVIYASFDYYDFAKGKIGMLSTYLWIIEWDSLASTAASNALPCKGQIICKRSSLTNAT